MQEIDYQRYLQAKESIDDRTLDQHIWRQFIRKLKSQSDRAESPLRFLDVGGGIGSMWNRLVRSQINTQIDYSLVDANQDNIVACKNRFQTGSNADGWDLSCYSLEFDDWVNRYKNSSFDVVIAQSFLDLVNANRFLDKLNLLLQNKTILYTPNTFDGLSHFLPPHPHDQEIIRHYHASMSHSNASGATTGRQLPAILRKHSFHINAIGSSDWTVIGNPVSKSYPDDDAYFLKCILHFVEDSLGESTKVSSNHLSEWLDRRHQQLTDGSLIYIAHQLDFLATKR